MQLEMNEYYQLDTTRIVVVVIRIKIMPFQAIFYLLTRNRNKHSMIKTKIVYYYYYFTIIKQNPLQFQNLALNIFNISVVFEESSSFCNFSFSTRDASHVVFKSCVNEFQLLLLLLLLVLFE